ncbi:MAG: proteic killer suppression protein [Rhodothermales bacterium]|jgi:proteic killer suppression protein
MIKSFRDRETRCIALGEYSSRFPVQIQHRAKMCLDKLRAMESVSELQSFQSLRLKKLRGNRKGQFSIRVNRQYRVCFEWVEGYAVNVELTDYH